MVYAQYIMILMHVKSADQLQMPKERLMANIVCLEHGWEKQASKFLQIPSGRDAAPLADTLSLWVPREASGPITHATHSCDSQSIYVSFEDGSVGVLTASTLRLRCRILPTAYLPPNPSLRPLESEGRWGTSPPTENGAGPSTTSGAAGSDQPQR
ncbi:hypothetical protein PRUPE_7G223200 [Prunus persica]|uniref:Uncharacterized protein n=1 Tax=Prunus persica TaxID=3760 RepID=M5W904_PRUPE|nr:hypothetical protein PRUPE_7G223200 [Prunus persica]